MKDRLRTYGEAVKTIDPSKAINGHYSDIWISWARLYIKHKDNKNANMVLHEATKVNFKSLEDHVSIWTFWVEYLIDVIYLYLGWILH